MTEVMTILKILDFSRGNMECAATQGELDSPTKLLDGTPIATFELSGLRCMIARVAEFALYASPSHSGALNHALANAELTQPSYLRRSALPPNVTETEFNSILVTYRAFQLWIDPLSSNRANAVSVVLVSDVQKLALDRRNRALLEALGGEVPRLWDLEEQQVQLAEEGFVDPVLDEVVEDLEELAAVQLQEELNAFEPYEEDEAAAGLLSSYTLKRPSRTLLSQFKEYQTHKMKKLAFDREGGAVEAITAESDVKTMQRLLGWLSLQKEVPPITSLSMLHTVQPSLMESYCHFLIERPVAYGSVANYMNGIYNMLLHVRKTPLVSAEDSESDHSGDEPVCSTIDALIEAVFNLRKQAEKEAKHQKLYRPRKKDWISWPDAREVRALDKCLLFNTLILNVLILIGLIDTLNSV
jgi:hypothetical protein